MTQHPQRVLMTVDAVGGVWRYATDLARGLNQQGIGCLLAGCGPRPAGTMSTAATGLSDTELVWIDEPLDWVVSDEAALDNLPPVLASLAEARDCDMLHLNLPSQAVGLADHLPLVVASHSCVPSWWETMRDTPLPLDWSWQRCRNRSGLDRADSVLVPSASHAAALVRTYGPIPGLSVVYNATTAVPPCEGKDKFILAAGRWWDEAKNARVLDEAAQFSPWPVMMAGPLAGPNGEVTCIKHARAVGDLSSGRLHGLMRRAAIFVAPSRYEPFGLAVLEAAIRHAALVLSDIPTFRELWSDAACFVPPGDAAGFGHAITRLAEDDALRHDFGSRAATVASRYTSARQLEGVLAAYAAAMKRHDPAMHGAE